MAFLFCLHLVYVIVMKVQYAFVGDADHSVPCRNYEMRTDLVIRAVGTLGSACPTVACSFVHGDV